MSGIQIMEMKPLATKPQRDIVVTSPAEDVVATPLTAGPVNNPQTATEISGRYEQAIAKVREAVADCKSSVWRLAWALLDFQELHHEFHPNQRLTSKHLGQLLKIELSPARIGQMINTANAYIRDQIDEKIDFRIYEEVRLLTDKKPKMTPEKRLAMVKANPNTASLNKLKSKLKPTQSSTNELIVRSSRAIGDEGNDLPTVEVKLNGLIQNIPEKLREPTATAIHNLFAMLLNDADK